MESPLRPNSKWIQFCRRNWKSFLVVALTLLFIQDIFGTHGVLAMRRSRKEVVVMQEQSNSLAEENCQLGERVQDLKSDPATIEEIARDKMGLARQGEVIFRSPQKPHEGQNESGEISLHPDSLQRCHQPKK